MIKWKEYLKKRDIIKKAKGGPIKKEIYNLGNIQFEQIFGKGKRSQIEKEYIEWRNTVRALGKDGLGIVGSAAKAMDKKYNNNLYEYVLDHVTAEVQRPGQPSRKGAKELGDLLEDIIVDENTPLTEEDEDDILAYVREIQTIGEEGSDRNPKNIPFTEPDDIIQNKEGKWEKSKVKRTVRGHYRTPMYVKMRDKVYGKKEAAAVNSSWYHYGAAGGPNTPPFWQALFANSSISNKSGKEVKNGLLGILERFQVGMEEMYLDHVVIKDTGAMKNRLDTLAQLKPLITKLEQLLKSSSTYSGNSAKVKYTGAGGLLTELANTEFRGKGSENYLTALFTGINQNDMPIGADKIANFKLVLTKATVDNLINQTIRAKQWKAPNGKPFILGTDTASKLRRYNFPWRQEVKKSWTDFLWG